MQTVELIEKSNADIKIFGGDINAKPILDDYQVNPDFIMQAPWNPINYINITRALL